MTIARKGETYGILVYDLSTREQNFCTDIATGREVPSVSEESKRLHLTECGEYIILLYLDDSQSGYITGIYATKKGSQISDDTIWKEVRFTDMQKDTFYPPHTPIRQDERYPIVEAAYGYVFYDGYVFYQNEDWNLCSRPLFGEEDEVVVYEGTALKEDQRGRVKELSCNLAFGDKNFYYQYYIEIDEGKAANFTNIQPEPIRWKGYMGKLP